jgi:primosomal protein N' (replication factor Y)
VAEKLGSRVEVKGPAPAPIEKIRDEYRWQVWYFVGSVSRVIGELSGLRDAFQWPDGMTQMLDVDPMNLV